MNHPISTRARKLQRAIRNLDKRRRRAAIEGLWKHAFGLTWPEPKRLYHLEIDAARMQVRFHRISEEEANEIDTMMVCVEREYGGTNERV